MKYLNHRLLRIHNKREIVAAQKNYMWVDVTSHRMSVIFRDCTAVPSLYLTITKILNVSLSVSLVQNDRDGQKQGQPSERR